MDLDFEDNVKEQWVDFFSTAGLPVNTSDDYANIFVHHAIELDMLPELREHYLENMGIHIQGHIIAILRHAKVYYAQMRKNSDAKKAPQVKSSVLVPKSSTRVEPAKSPQNTRTNGTKIDLTRKTPPVAAKPAIPTQGLNYSNTAKSTSVAVARKRPAAVVASKAQVAPVDNDIGVYKIIMPTGTTPRSKEILSKSANVPGAKKSVFDRLGQNPTVSSSTDSGESLNKRQRMSVTTVNPGSNAPKSVFSRLGGKLSSKDGPVGPVMYGPVAPPNQVTSVKLDLKPYLTDTTIIFESEKPSLKPCIKSKPSLNNLKITACNSGGSMVADREMALNSRNSGPSVAVKNRLGVVPKSALRKPIQPLPLSVDPIISSTSSSRIVTGNSKKVSFGAVSQQLYTKDKPGSQLFTRNNVNSLRKRSSVGMASDYYGLT